MTNFQVNSEVNSLVPEHDVNGNLVSENLIAKKRTFKERYSCLSTQEQKNNILYKKLYNILELLDLSKDEKVAALYGLGDAIAGSKYPVKINKLQERIKKRILKETQNMTQQELDKLFDEIILQLNSNSPSEFQETQQVMLEVKGLTPEQLKEAGYEVKESDTSEPDSTFEI